MVGASANGASARYNLEVVDGKIMQKEFVVASPQQQQVIANFTASSTKRRLVLEPLLVSL